MSQGYRKICQMLILIIAGYGIGENELIPILEKNQNIKFLGQSATS